MISETRKCQSCKEEFTIEPEDFQFYEKIDVPPPTWCPDCRAMRRMVFYNMRHLYKRTCDGTGKEFYTQLPPSAPMPLYTREYFISDNWDVMDYGQDIDWSRPFFEQFIELYRSVPWSISWHQNMVNSEYSIGKNQKNCYLCFDTGDAEDSAYSVTLQQSSKCLDMINCESCELCYFCINTNRSYKTFFSRSCESCHEVWLSQDCVGCSNCFGCSGLHGKSYHIFNQPYSKDSYAAKLKEMNIDSWSGLEQARTKVMETWNRYPVKYQHSTQAKDCTGDYIYNANELRNCFFAGNAQNCAHSQSIIYGPIRDCMDSTSAGDDFELGYEVGCSGLNIRNIRCVSNCDTVFDSQYITRCSQSNNLFGCVGLRSKNYCILNKQYSKEAYKSLVPKIIEHMHEMPYVDKQGRVYKYGEFFPIEMSPWAYNETQAYEYFPLTKEAAERLGYRWREFEERGYEATISAKDLPERIAEVDDDILKEVIRCAHDENKNHSAPCGPGCSTAFRITAQELQFYRQLNLPIPRLCFNCRHFERVGWRNPPHLYHRNCQCAGKGSGNGMYDNVAAHHKSHALDKPCPNEFETSYAPDRKEIVYCEQCYQAEVV